MCTDQDKEIRALIERIVETDGYLSAMSKTLAKGPYDPNQFLVGCYELSGDGSLIKLWGEELIRDIVEYNEKYNGTIILNTT